MASTDITRPTCTDLTGTYGGVRPLAPSSQAATNTVSDNSAAMTAPGSDSESTAHETPGDPTLSATACDGRQLESGDAVSHLGDGASRTWQTMTGRQA